MAALTERTETGQVIHHKVDEFRYVPETPKHSIAGMTLFVVDYFENDKYCKRDCGLFVMSPNAKAAKDVLWDMDDVFDPKRIKVAPITSEQQFREYCKPENDRCALIEDVRDYTEEGFMRDTPYCSFASELLPLLREEWRQFANREEEARCQLKLFTVKRSARARKAVGDLFEVSAQ